MTPTLEASPQSYLWAHQLKREHAYLLERMRKLESTNQQQEQRLKATEDLAESGLNNNFTALSDRVQTLEEGGCKKRLRQMEENIMSKIDDLEAETEAITVKMSSLEKSEALAEEEKRKAFNKEKALLKRVGECEKNLKTYEVSLEQVGRSIDSASITQIKSQLKSLIAQVEKEGPQMKFLSDSIVALELANAELQKANVRLEADIAKIIAKPSQSSAAKARAVGKAAPKSGSKSTNARVPETPPHRKPKSHRWADGGTDRGIIGHSSSLSARSTSRPTPKSSKQIEITTRKTVTSMDVDPRQRKKAVPKATVTTSAPKSTVAPAVVASKPTSRTSLPVTKAAGKPDMATQISKYIKPADAGKRISRAGKGWIEYVDDESGDGEEDAVEKSATKRPGRPRKEESQHMFDGLDLRSRTEATTRSTRTSLVGSTTASRKRKADEIEVSPEQNIKPNIVLSHAEVDDSKQPEKDARSTEVFQSPKRDVTSTEKKHTTMHARGFEAIPINTMAIRSEPPPAKKRRVIEQYYGNES